MIRLLFIGDIVGRPGRDIVTREVPRLRSEMSLDFVIANGENAAAGSGINTGIVRALLDAKVDAITLGDHVWDQKGFEHEIGNFDRLCRPANLPAKCPGRTHVTLRSMGGFRLVVATVLGRQFMGPKPDCPFITADKLINDTVGAGQADAALIEIHGEVTSEKQAMGWYLDGRAVAVLGTHTHVPTADASILPNGTGFICDVGMTGPYNGVIGRAAGPVIGRFLDGMPRRFDIAEGDVRLSGALIEYDTEARRTTRCSLFTYREDAGKGARADPRSSG